jgi:hypothetical protein
MQQNSIILIQHTCKESEPYHAPVNWNFWFAGKVIIIVW